MKAIRSAMNWRLAWALAAALVALPAKFVLAGPLQLTFTDLTACGASITIVDNGIYDQNPEEGIVQYYGKVGAFRIQESTLSSSPVSLNGSQQEVLQLHNTISSRSGGPIQIAFSNSYSAGADAGSWISWVGGGHTGQSLNAWQSINLGSNDTVNVNHGPWGSGLFTNQQSNDVTFAGGSFDIDGGALVSLNGNSLASFSLASFLSASSNSDSGNQDEPPPPASGSDGAGNDSPSTPAVPEPSTWALLVLGGLMLGGYSWRNRQRGGNSR